MKARRMESAVNAYFFNPFERTRFEVAMDDLDQYLFGHGIHTSNVFAKLTMTEWDTLKNEKGGRK